MRRGRVPALHILAHSGRAFVTTRRQLRFIGSRLFLRNLRPALRSNGRAPQRIPGIRVASQITSAKELYMVNLQRRLLTTIALSVVAPVVVAAVPARGQETVFVMSNNAERNQVIAFERQN